MTSNAPSPELLHSLRHQLRTHAPFSQMQAEHVERFIEASRFARFASDDVVLAPASGPVMYLYFVQEGGVVGQQGLADAAGGFRYDTGDLFPVGAALGRRAVSATYVADGDTSCWMLPGDEMDRLAQDSPPFADFLNRRVVQFLDISRRALQASYLSQSLAEQSLESTLGSLTRRTPLAVLPDTSLQHALALMHQRQVGSILVNNLSDEPVGILTRHDVLGRVTLPQIPLSTPIAQVMSQPIRVLQLEDTAQDALLLMSREGIRHVPVVDKGKAVSMVSERDLFALHRLSLKQVSTGIRSSTDVQALQLCATKIRELTRQLMGQGVHARQLTELISHLNDLLAERLVSLMAARHGLKLDQACWFVHAYDDVSGDCLLVRGVAESGAVPVATEPSSEPEVAELPAVQQPAVAPDAPPPSVPAYVDQFSEPTAAAQREVTMMVRDRSAAVRERVLRRACGVCELCGEPGFVTAAGSIYLETHHVIPLSLEGPDHDSNVVALCPNDHRRAHFGIDREATEGRLKALVLRMEA